MPQEGSRSTEEDFLDDANDLLTSINVEMDEAQESERVLITASVLLRIYKEGQNAK